MSFGARLGLATSLLIVVVCASQSWMLARRDLGNLRRYLADRGHGVSATVAREAAASIAAGNLEMLRRIAEQTRAESGVGYVRIFDPRGLLLVSSGSPAGHAPPLVATSGRPTVGPIPIGDDTWEFQAPILGGPGTIAGTVAVGLSLEPLQEIRRRSLTTATFFSTLFTLAAILGALVLARAITRPLGALASAADTIARGDFAARVEVHSRDEIGAVARSFNAMVESLARSRASLEEKVDELEQANRLKSEFLATISHELRTPLNVIIGYVEMLAEGTGGRVSAEQAEMIGAIQRYSKLQLDLITSVLDFSRLSSGKISFHVERFALGPLLAEVQALYAGRLRGPRVRLDTYADARLPELETDRVKLQEIVRNLVDNAVKFTEQGVISVSACPGVDPGRVRIEVTDTGTGIEAADLQAIFDAFHQIGDSGTRRTGGVGLGLSIVRQLSEALGGSVSVTSRPHAGSTFLVDLPCSLPGLGAAPADAAASDALDQVTLNAATLPERTERLRLTAVARRARRPER